MSNADIHKAHKLLDYVSQGRAVLDDEIKLLRSFLPERPKDATLVDLLDRVHAAWLSANPSDWGFDTPAEHHDWLFDLRNDLVRIIEEQDAPATVPSLPDGMRLADHEEYGRVVVSPGANRDGYILIFTSNDAHSSRAAWHYVEVDTLNFVNVAPAHPEFLETEEDYQNAPVGTIVASSGRFPWVKGAAGEWACSSSNNSNFAMSKIGRRNVLRWGWGDK